MQHQHHIICKTLATCMQDFKNAVSVGKTAAGGYTLQLNTSRECFQDGLVTSC